MIVTLHIEKWDSDGNVMNDFDEITVDMEDLLNDLLNRDGRKTFYSVDPEEDVSTLTYPGPVEVSIYNVKEVY